MDPGPFALTSWWWTQSRETGLGVKNSLLAGKVQGIYTILGRVSRKWRP
jgi:hypothetical protein